MTEPLVIHRPGGQPPAPGTGPAAGGMGSLKKKPGVLLAAGGAGLVVLIALVRKGSGSAATTGTTTTTGTTATGTGTYDSTSNDLYNSIQPEIDALAQQLQQLQNKQPTPSTPGVPKPKPKPKPKKKIVPVVSTKHQKPAAQYVTIQKNNTLSGIAASNHLSFGALKTLNPAFFTNPKYHGGNLIFPGGHVRVK